jgi:hypothetical protein
VVIYYAAADGVGQRVKWAAAATSLRARGSLFLTRAIIRPQTLTAGRVRAGKEERMKRVMLIASAAAAALLVAAIAYGAASPQTKTHQFRCTDRNTSLYFIVYESGGKLNGGHMYVENMQVGVLTAENAGTNVIKASVVGNTATNIAFQFHKSPGSVMVANYGDNPRRVEVCKASYKYQ